MATEEEFLAAMRHARLVGGSNKFGPKTNHSTRATIYWLWKAGYTQAEIAEYFCLREDHVSKICTSKNFYKKVKEDYAKVGNEGYFKTYVDVFQHVGFMTFVNNKLQQAQLKARTPMADAANNYVANPRANKYAGPEFAIEAYERLGGMAYPVWIEKCDPKLVLDNLGEEWWAWWQETHGEGRTHPMVIAGMQLGGGWGYATINYPEGVNFFLDGGPEKNWLYRTSTAAYNHIKKYAD